MAPEPTEQEIHLRQFSKVNTCSIAFPSSIFDNTPTPQFEAYLVGQIARAATVFHVNELILYDEDASMSKKWGDSSPTVSRIAKLVKLFEYAECPQYLRKSIFPIEPDLKFAGLINPLEAQHHLRSHQVECPYREGIIVSQSASSTSISDSHILNNSKYVYNVDIGLSSPVEIEHTKPLDIMTRVTVKVDPLELRKIQPKLLKHISKPITAQVVSPAEPVTKLNLYWGYYVRTASCLSTVMSENTFVPANKKFYDLIIGTSERGTSVDEVDFTSRADTTPVLKNQKTEGDEIEDGKAPKKRKGKPLKPRHALVVFGGIKGLENAVAHDDGLKKFSHNIPSIFHYYLNTCPNQGSTTIRTEEAILVTLSALRPKLKLTSHV